MDKLSSCKCGGRPIFVDKYMVDSLECSNCDYKTQDYFDGLDYAIKEWEERNKRENN